MNIREAPRLPFFHAGPRDWPSTADLFGYGSVVAEPGSFCMVLLAPHINLNAVRFSEHGSTHKNLGSRKPPAGFDWSFAYSVSASFVLP